MDLQIFLTWYINFFIFGIIGLPFAEYFFKKWPDKGYAFSKIIGLIIIALPLWFLASIKLVQFNNTSVFVITVVFFALVVFLKIKHHKGNSLSKLSIKNLTKYKYAILEEFIFLILFIFWVQVRSRNPQIEGTEKFMDLAFMNSIDRSEYFPPLDPWYAGKTINYYYLGHYFFTFVAKLTSISINYAYNLSIITIIALSFISLSSIFFRLFNHSRFRVQILFGLIGASIICFGGNLHFFFNLLQNIASNINLNQIFLDPLGWFYSLFSKSGYFFSNATRIIPYTINEFPAYSIVLGDLHPHYNALPFFILVVAFSLVSLDTKFLLKDKIKFNLLISPFLVILFGINSWDFLTLLVLFLFIHLYQTIKTKENKLTYFLFSELSLLLGIIFILPFIFSFNPPIGGIGIVLLRQDVDERISQIQPWLLMWGVHLSITIIFFIANIAGLVKRKIRKVHVWSFILIILSFCLVFGVEIFYIKDLFDVTTPEYFRANTVFKFYYHAWIIWGIVIGFFIYQLIVNFYRIYKFKRIITILFIGFLYFGSILYIFKAITDFYPVLPVFGNKTKEMSLDGYSYIDKNHSGDYQAITWINNNIKGQPVIVEAVGEAYTYYARISTNTGLLSVLGWPTHEWQWRNIIDNDIAFQLSNNRDDLENKYETKNERELVTYINRDRIFSEINEDVSNIYQSSSIDNLKALIAKYNVEYIYIGELELKKYTNINEENIQHLARLVYDQNSTKIYKVRGG